MFSWVTCVPPLFKITFLSGRIIRMVCTSQKATEKSRMEVLFGLVTPSLNGRLLLRVSPGNSRHTLFHMFCASALLWPYPLTSDCSTVRSLWPENAPPGWRLPKMPEMEFLYKVKGAFSTLVCASKQKKWPARWWPGGPFYSKLQQPPCTVTHRVTPTHLPLPMHPFC